MKLSAVFPISFTTLALVCDPDTNPAVCDAPSVQLNPYSDSNCGNFEEAISTVVYRPAFVKMWALVSSHRSLPNWNPVTSGCDLFSEVHCPDANRLSKKSPTTGVDGVSSDMTTSSFGSGSAQILSVACLWESE